MKTRKNNPHSKQSKTHKSAIVLAVLILGVACILGYRHFNDSGAQTSSANDTINYGPATQQEKDEADAHKDEIVAQKQAEEAANDSPGTKKAATPVITSASQDNVSAFVTGIVEEGGSCTLTLTNANEKVTKKSAAFANASTTNCQPFSLSRSDFSTAGSWSAIVAYESESASGVSQPKTFEVQ